MVLSDRSIKEELAAGRLVIDPLDLANVQPASVDVRLDRTFRVFKVSSRPYIDVREEMDELTEEVVIGADRPFFIHPGEFVLASTLEVVTLPDDILAQVEGKSSLGRIGLLIHATAGFVDPGWTGKLTLELSNVAKMPIALHFGMSIDIPNTYSRAGNIRAVLAGTVLSDLDVLHGGGVHSNILLYKRSIGRANPRHGPSSSPNFGHQNGTPNAPHRNRISGVAVWKAAAVSWTKLRLPIDRSSR